MVARTIILYAAIYVMYINLFIGHCRDQYNSIMISTVSLVPIINNFKSGFILAAFLNDCLWNVMLSWNVVLSLYCFCICLSEPEFAFSLQTPRRILGLVGCEITAPALPFRYFYIFTGD